MSSDPSWMERLWYTGHPRPAGDFIFDVGLGWHPNRNVMDGFAGVAFAGKQYNFRASRRLRPDPLTTEIGPMKIEVLEGLRRHRLTLAPNESRLSFDLEFVATMNPHEEEPHFRRRSGRVTEQMARAQQLGARPESPPASSARNSPMAISTSARFRSAFRCSGRLS